VNLPLLPIYKHIALESETGSGYIKLRLIQKHLNVLCFACFNNLRRWWSSPIPEKESITSWAFGHLNVEDHSGAKGKTAHSPFAALHSRSRFALYE
jgi:hypothetical protein